MTRRRYPDPVNQIGWAQHYIDARYGTRRGRWRRRVKRWVRLITG